MSKQRRPEYTADVKEIRAALGLDAEGEASTVLGAMSEIQLWEAMGTLMGMALNEAYTRYLPNAARLALMVELLPQTARELFPAVPARCLATYRDALRASAMGYYAPLPEPLTDAPDVRPPEE